MEVTIVDQLSALAHPKRLDLFRLLMRRYPDAVPAGEIAEALDLKPNTTSVYLNALRQADLITQTRRGTSLLYTASLPTMRGLFDTLLSDCCRSRPDICVPGTVPGTPAPLTRPMPDRVFNVLFLCTGNSARSLMAEAILRAEGEGRFHAFSAGTDPKGEMHPGAVEILRAHGYDVDGLSPKSSHMFTGPSAPPMDFVITVCDRAANADCPTWPGGPLSAHWGLPDPVSRSEETDDAAERRNIFRATFAQLQNRIRAFASLPIGTLDRIALQHQLDDIGRMRLDAPAT